MFTLLSDPGEFRQLVNSEKAVVALFFGERCTVCHALEPKADRLFREYFPEMKRFAVNVEKAPELAVQNSVFTVPVVIVFFDGQEFLRKAGSFSLTELHTQTRRAYRLMFS